MAGKFEIFKDKGGKFRFRLKASNGEIVLASQGYASKSGCKNGVASVQKNCGNANCFDKKAAKNGFRFNLKSTNGQVIGTSETYSTEKACDNGIASISRAANGATVVDLTVA